MKIKSKKKKLEQVAKKRLSFTEPLSIKKILVPIDFSEHSKNAL